MAAPAACNARCRCDTNIEKEEVPMLRLFLALLISVALVCTTGCETFKGVGRDVQKGGEKIEDAAGK
jgi:predicted small secreted protein